MKQVFGAVCGVAFAGLVAMPSSASTVELEVIGMPNSALASAQINSVEVEPLGTNEFGAGSFLMQDVNTLEEFIAWCIQIDTLIDRAPTEYDTSAAILGADQERLISQLYTGYFGETETDVGAAAFQLAIWEIVEESSLTAALSVSNGVFTAASSVAGVVDTANAFLAGLSNFDADYRITYFRSADSQDLITASPVPLPAGILFLGAGLGALAMFRRRKNIQAANS